MYAPPAEPYVSFEAQHDGQTWVATWYPPDDVPDGKRHGSAGVCITDSGDLVLITQDGKNWEFPAGRPEGDETWEETMCREVREEACVEVREARLLGFSQGKCIQGHEKGLILVRSAWLAQVDVLEWTPEPQILDRVFKKPSEVLE